MSDHAQVLTNQHKRLEAERTLCRHFLFRGPPPRYLSLFSDDADKSVRELSKVAGGWPKNLRGQYSLVPGSFFTYLLHNRLGAI